jgi:WD40 repeat protein
MSDIFISYSRNDLTIAEKIIDALAKDDLEPWIDWKSIPKGETFWSEIQQGIEAAEIFLFLVSPDSTRSDWCNKEIVHAVKNGKRILPIVIRDTDPKTIHPEISKRNWIFCREGQNDFNKAIEETRKTINTDYEWLKYHTELQVKALKWERKKDNSRLLRGKELREAEQQFAEVSSQEDPQPTKVQREYILASQRNEVHQRRQVMVGLGFGLVIVTVLAIFAWAQRNEAVFQAKVSRAGELAAQSISLRDTNFQLSMLLGIKAFQTSDTLQSSGVLLDNINSHPRLIQYLMGQMEMKSVAFSPDGKLLASGGCTKTDDWGYCTQGGIILWDVTSRQPIGQPLTGYGGSIHNVAFSPDGKVLAFGVSDGTIVLLEIATLQPIHQLLTEHSAITSLVFSPDSKTLASGSYDGVSFFGVETGKPIGYLPTVRNVVFSPDGETFTAVEESRSITLWDVATLQKIGQPFTDDVGADAGLAFSPDGKMLAVFNHDLFSESVELWDVITQQSIDQINTGRHTNIYSATFSPDGKMLAFGGCADRFVIGNSEYCTQGEIVLWDVATRKLIEQPLTGHTSFVYSVTFSPDGKMLASVSDDHSIILWDIDLEQPSLISEMIAGHSDPVRSVAFSPDGRILASGSEDHNIIIWDVETRKPISTLLSQQAGKVSGVVFSPDGKILASGSDDGTIVLWDVTTEKPISNPLKNPNFISNIAFSADGKTLASVGYHAIILWDITTQQPVGQPIDDQGITDQQSDGFIPSIEHVAFSPTGKILAFCNNVDTIILWDFAAQQSLGKIIAEHGLVSMAFSPDGKILVSGGDDGTITLWDVATQRPIGQPLLDQSIVSSMAPYVESVAFSPDGKLLATGYPFEIILWDIETRQPIGRPFPLGARTLAFSPDSKTLASDGMNNSITLWDIDPSSWIVKSCQRVGRNLTRAEWEKYIGTTQPYQAICPNLPIEPEVIMTPTP